MTARDGGSLRQAPRPGPDDDSGADRNLPDPDRAALHVLTAGGTGHRRYREYRQHRHSGAQERGGHPHRRDHAEPNDEIKPKLEDLVRRSFSSTTTVLASTATATARAVGTSIFTPKQLADEATKLAAIATVADQSNRDALPALIKTMAEYDAFNEQRKLRIERLRVATPMIEARPTISINRDHRARVPRDFRIARRPCG